MKRYLLLLHVAVVLILLFSSCASPNSYYMTGTQEQKAELKSLFHHLENSADKNESRFILLQQIIKILHEQGETEKLNLLLTTYVEQNPEDPFNAYYLFIVAQNYKRGEAYPFATHYYERILRNYPDLLVRDRSIHLLSLKELIQFSVHPEIRVTYYKELLSRFESEIDKGLTYYQLAKTYEELGEWDLSIQAYMNYLKYPDTYVPGAPEAYSHVEQLVRLYTYDGSDWTVDDLDVLVADVKKAINWGQPWRLREFMSKINFFTTSWEQQESQVDETFGYNLGTFLNSRVRCNAELDTDSNAQEAYLKTTGWSYRIKTWYLYFRKIHFPADPEKHGQWEWAGIYLGEKPFTGSATEEL
jgi:tetratricopeptide (TPR) repeat protein